MKRVIEVEIPDGPMCKGCNFFYWGDGGFDQSCVLYDKTLNTGRLVEGDPSTYGTFKCHPCLIAPATFK